MKVKKKKINRKEILRKLPKLLERHGVGYTRRCQLVQSVNNYLQDYMHWDKAKREKTAQA